MKKAVLVSLVVGLLMSWVGVASANGGDDPQSDNAVLANFGQCVVNDAADGPPVAASEGNGPWNVVIDGAIGRTIAMYTNGSFEGMSACTWKDRPAIFHGSGDWPRFPQNE